ncbi:ComF family protein [Candidatus Peregrinibacteria bacterium]|jgi:competence protein ComFC|nr:ComF family protein [Candidatus Peregrinibacteria bacterium]MBT5823744.1 ComF family protein [Candidatus Peregrinibacteria bacterium]
MLHLILKILFPSPCLSCGYLSEALCKWCISFLDFKPHIREINGLRVCSATFFEKGSILERLIYPFKYSHQANIFRIFVPEMERALRLLIEPSGVLFVPVPLYVKRERERGYNQAELLARSLAIRIGANYEMFLHRIRDTASQVEIGNRVERLKNLNGAFVLVGLADFSQRIVLVDDIVTTGSTLLECYKVLSEAGYTNVSALTLADRPLDNDLG